MRSEIKNNSCGVFCSFLEKVFMSLYRAHERFVLKTILNINSKFSTDLAVMRATKPVETHLTGPIALFKITKKIRIRKIYPD